MFDLWWAASNRDLDIDKLLRCYHEYMQFVVGKPPTAKQFLQNLDEKMTSHEFKQDINGLLRPGIEYAQEKGYKYITNRLITQSM